MSTKINASLVRNSASNSVDVTLTDVTFTDVIIRVYDERGNFRFQDNLASAQIDASGSKITWTPTAKQTKNLPEDCIWTVDALVSGVWSQYVTGDLSITGAGTVASGGGAALPGGSSGTPDEYPAIFAPPGYYAKNGQSSVGETAAPPLVPGLGSAVFVPWAVDRDMKIDGIVAIAGVTVSAAKMQCAIWKAGATGPRGVPSNAPDRTSNEANNAVKYTAGLMTLNSALTVKKGELYWIALLSSDALCGYCMCADDTMSTKWGIAIASGGLADLFIAATAIHAGCGLLAGGLFTYASPAVSWPANLNNNKPTTPKAWAPSLFLKAAA